MAYPQPSRNTQIVAVVAVAAIAILVTVVALYAVMLQNPGSVTDLQTFGVEVYWEANRTNKVSAVDWGYVEVGGSRSVTIYLLNSGSTDIWLSINSAKWSPENAAEHLTLSWDYQNQTLEPNGLLRTTLTLNADPTAQEIASFAFDIIISAHESS